MRNNYLFPYKKVKKRAELSFKSSYKNREKKKKKKRNKKIFIPS